MNTELPAIRGSAVERGVARPGVRVERLLQVLPVRLAKAEAAKERRFEAANGMLS